MRIFLGIATLVAACTSRPPPAQLAPHRSACPGPAWRPLAEALDQRAPSVAALERPDLTIAEVSVVGAPELVATLATARGGRLRDARIDDDVRSLWALGMFADVRVDVTKHDNGAHVAFVVKAHPLVDRVVVDGDRRLARLRALAGGAFEPGRIDRLADEIREGYISDGYLDARITVHRAVARPDVALCVDADRGPRVHIGEIKFAGRDKLPEAALGPDELGIHPGSVARREVIERATLVLASIYWDHGMAKVRVGDPILVRQGDRLDIEFPIVEGDVYQFGKITLENGNGLTLPATISPGQRYSQKQIIDVREALDVQLRGRDVTVITSSTPYTQPRTEIDDVSRTVAVTFVINRP